MVEIRTESEGKMVKSASIVIPKFLTSDVAKTAVEFVLTAIYGLHFGRGLSRKACHVVVLVPVMQDHRAEDYPDWPNYSLEPHCLYEHSLGDKKDWPHTFDDVARCKALQLWHDRNDGGTNVMPHLLFPGDTPYWGGVKRQGIVVACSGVQPWFDKMISGMISEMIIAIAHDKWMTSDDRFKNLDFLS